MILHLKYTGIKIFNIILYLHSCNINNYHCQINQKMMRLYTKIFTGNLVENRNERRKKMLLKSIMQIIFICSFIILVIIARYYAL